MEIRPLDTRQDVREAIVAHTRSWQAAYDDILPADLLSGMPTDPDAEAVEEWRARHPPESVTLGVVGDGRIRGYIHMRWAETKPFVGANEASLKELYVHPDWWGEGFGSALFESGLEQVPDEVAGMALDVFAANARARIFYEAHGFEPDEHDTVDLGGETYKTVIYRRQL